jgi:hypothetical protein
MIKGWCQTYVYDFEEEAAHCQAIVSLFAHHLLRKKGKNKNEQEVAHCQTVVSLLAHHTTCSEKIKKNSRRP